MAEHAHGASRWYRPPTPTLFESVEEELDALELEGLHLDPYDQDHAPPVYAADDDDDSEDDGVDDFDVNEDDMHAFGIPAARGWRLDARYVARLTRSESDTLAFAQRILDMFAQVLHLPGWQAADVAPAMLPLVPERVTLKRISGALTNAVFFVGYRAPDGVQPAPPTYLLRVYGAGSEALLSRRTELLILHTLSSLYEIGPHILGTFANGRIEGTSPCSRFPQNSTTARPSDCRACATSARQSTRGTRAGSLAACANCTRCPSTSCALSSSRTTPSPQARDSAAASRRT